MKQAILSFDTPALQTYINFMLFLAAMNSPSVLYLGEALRLSDPQNHE